MYTGFYETDMDKIALCTESVKTAKIALVQEHGVGSDLNINIFGWKKNELLIIAQLKKTFALSKDERLPLIIEAACVLRQGWGLDEFTLAAEVYCTMAPAQTQGFIKEASSKKSNGKLLFKAILISKLLASSISPGPGATTKEYSG